MVCWDVVGGNWGTFVELGQIDTFLDFTVELQELSFLNWTKFTTVFPFTEKMSRYLLNGGGDWMSIIWLLNGFILYWMSNTRHLLNGVVDLMSPNLLHHSANVLYFFSEYKTFSVCTMSGSQHHLTLLSLCPIRKYLFIEINTSHVVDGGDMEASMSRHSLYRHQVASITPGQPRP